jgi:hypothetical protein
VLVYEIIIFDIIDEKEFCRLYVYQSEVVMQLRKRGAMVQHNRIKQLKSEVASLPLVPPPSSSPVANPNSRQHRAKQAKKRMRRRTDQELAERTASEWQSEQLEDLSKLTADDDVIDLDTVESHTLNSKTLPPLFFPRVILTCLKSTRVHGMEHRFWLLNDLTLLPFNVFANIPEELKSLLPTIVDAKTLIIQAKRVAAVADATSSLKRIVNAAHSFTEHAHVELRAMDVEQVTYADEGKLNPNTMKWRMMWQKSINAIIRKNKLSRRVRSDWTVLMKALVAEKREKEALARSVELARLGLASERAGGGSSGFRKLRTRRKGILVSSGSGLGDNNGGGSSSSAGEIPLTPEDMVQYREEMAHRRQLKREKTNKMLNIGKDGNM